MGWLLFVPLTMLLCLYLIGMILIKIRHGSTLKAMREAQKLSSAHNERELHDDGRDFVTCQGMHGHE